MDQTAVFIWGGLTVVTVLIELKTLSLISIWFTAGSLPALIMAIQGFDAIHQFLVFAIVSSLSLFVGIKFIKKKINTKYVNTNVDAYSGKVAVLTIGFVVGSIGETKFDGKLWAVKSLSSDIFKDGEEVLIVGIEGNKLVVEKQQTPQINHSN